MAVEMYLMGDFWKVHLHSSRQLVRKLRPARTILNRNKGPLCLLPPASQKSPIEM